MKHVILITVGTLSTLFFLHSCSKEEVNETGKASLNNVCFSCEDHDNSDENSFEPLPDNLVAVAKQLGEDPSKLQYFEFGLPSMGKKQGNVVFEDMTIRVEDFLAAAEMGVDARQYAHIFIVDTSQYSTIDLWAYTGPTDPENGFTGLSQAAQNALVAAVDNWNQANARLQFTVTFSSNTSEFTLSQFETLVGALPISSTGTAQLPNSAGAPGQFALINDVINSNSTNADGLEHLWTHEIGHVAGLRHSDWNNKQSCVNLGIPVNTNPEGALSWIFGTPNALFFQDNSIMNACFSFSTTTGELNIHDKNAFTFLYGDLNDPYPGF